MTDDDTAAKIQSILNATGFPFQLYVQLQAGQQILREPGTIATGRHYELHLVASEYGWRDSEGSGFIDTVLGATGEHDPHTQLRVVVETKRYSEDVSWIFLASGSEVPITGAASLLRAWRGTSANYLQWMPHTLAPKSPSAPFCVVSDLETGKRHGEQPESLAGQLLQACEAIARQEDIAGRPVGAEYRPERVYLPLLVTNCRLFSARCDPTWVVPASGVLPSRFELDEVPLIRFQKSFATSVPAFGADLTQLAKGLERTVIVVSARYLSDFLVPLADVRAL